MNITSAQYGQNINKENEIVRATIDGVEMIVPIDAEGNRHWEAIQKWVSDGNTIEEAD